MLDIFFLTSQINFYVKEKALKTRLKIKRARDGTRTRDPDLGKVVLHQLSHSRIQLLYQYNKYL